MTVVTTETVFSTGSSVHVEVVVMMVVVVVIIVTRPSLKKKMYFTLVTVTITYYSGFQNLLSCDPRSTVEYLSCVTYKSNIYCTKLMGEVYSKPKMSILLSIWLPFVWKFNKDYWFNHISLLCLLVNSFVLSCTYCVDISPMFIIKSFNLSTSSTISSVNSITCRQIIS